MRHTSFVLLLISFLGCEQGSPPEPAQSREAIYARATEAIRQRREQRGTVLRPAGRFEVTPTTSRGNVPSEGVLMMRLMMRLSGDASHRPPGTVVEMREGDIIARCTIVGTDSQRCSSGRIHDPQFTNDAGPIERL